MIFKGLIDQNYRILNKEISQTNIEPSPDKVRFTIDGSTEDNANPTTNANPDTSLTFVDTQDSR